MKKFTKMFSTLMLLCVAGVANAQDWQALPTTGWVHEWQKPVWGDVNGDKGVNSADVQKTYSLMAQGATGETNPEADVNHDESINSADIQKIYGIMAGTAVNDQTVVPTQYDGAVEANEEGILSLYVRSAEEAFADGNGVTTNGQELAEDYSNFADWDSQFFITVGEENDLKADDVFRVTMDVMATANVTVGTQAHANPGNYIHWACCGNITFSTDWTTFEVTVTNDMVNGKKFYTIALNLATVKAGEGFTCYFKNIKVEKKIITVDPYADWVSIMGTPVKKEYPGNPEEATPNGSGEYEVNCPAKVAETWDSQFWITLNQKLAAGKKARVTFEYMATAAYTVGTQSHQNPGNYIHWAAIGNVSFGTEWKSFATTMTVPDQCDGSMDQGGFPKDFRSIAFNLSENTDEDVVYYFRNIDVKVAPEDVGEVIEPETVWVDIMQNGTLEGDDARCIYTKDAGGDGAPKIGTIEDGIGKEGTRGVKVTSADREDTGEVDDQGNPKYTGADWDAQFWIRLPQSLPAGTKIKVTFNYKASNDGRVDTQSHNEPGQYIHWACIGSPEFTTDWQSYEKETTVPSQCDGSENNGYLNDFRSIAFNLSCNKMATEFFFDNIKVEIPQEAVTAE